MSPPPLFWFPILTGMLPACAPQAGDDDTAKADADTGADTNTDTAADTNTDTEPDSDTTADSDSDTTADSDSATTADSDTDTDTDTSTAAPVADLTIVGEAGVVYRWYAGEAAPTELVSVPVVTSALRGETGSLNLLYTSGERGVVDPDSGEITLTGTGRRPFVDCGGYLWSYSSDARRVVAEDSSGEVLSVSLAPLDDARIGSTSYGEQLAAWGGTLYLGYYGDQRTSDSGIAAVDCATGELGSPAITSSWIDSLIVDHDVLVVLEGSDMETIEGGVELTRLDSDTSISQPTVYGMVHAWGGMPGELQFARVTDTSWATSMVWFDGVSPTTTLPDLSISPRDHNFVVLFDGTDPAQAWMIDETGTLVAFQIVASGATWEFVPLATPDIGPVVFVDTPAP